MTLPAYVFTVLDLGIDLSALKTQNIWKEIYYNIFKCQCTSSRPAT